MSIINVTSANFETEVLQSDVPVLVDFNAQWCGPCRMLKPTLEALAEGNPSYKIASVDVDDEGELAIRYGVSAIPCLLVFKGGKEVNRSVGLISKEAVAALVEG